MNGGNLLLDISLDLHLSRDDFSLALNATEVESGHLTEHRLLDLLSKYRCHLAQKVSADVL